MELPEIIQATELKPGGFYLLQLDRECSPEVLANIASNLRDAGKEKNIHFLLFSKQLRLLSPHDLDEGACMEIARRAGLID